ETRKLLKPQEALIAIYSTQKQTLVWAVPAAGEPAFHIAELPAAKVAEAVAKLRKALDPSEADVGQVPTYDFDTSHEIYRKLLAPVEAGWKSARELIVVPHGALAELPFSVLVTAPYKPVKSALPFADHAAAPWRDPAPREKLHRLRRSGIRLGGEARPGAARARTRAAQRQSSAGAGQA